MAATINLLHLRSSTSSIRKIKSQSLYRFRALPTSSSDRRTYASVSPITNPNLVHIVEVGPRDGLQNEKAVIPPAVKIELINRLGRAGMTSIEAGSFVSPKWVPQMAGTAEVISQMERRPGVHYPVLVPNQRGLDDLLALLSSHSSSSPATSEPEPPPTNEIAIFTAATDAFCQANTNCSISESLSRLASVTSKALQSGRGLRVRGYVSVVITCPYSGRVDFRTVRDVTKELLDMGCYEVSLGDTTGTGTPGSVLEMLEVVAGKVPVNKLAGHFHDTFGSALSNIFAFLSAGVRTFDSSIAGLGGCPYSPGATGNVATEDVVHALTDSGFQVASTNTATSAPATTDKRREGMEEGVAEGPDMDVLVETGFWISEMIGKRNESRAGRALRARKERKESEEKEAVK